MKRKPPMVFIALDGIENSQTVSRIFELIGALLRVPGVSPETVGFKLSQSAFLAHGVKAVPQFLDDMGVPASYQIFLDTKFATEERELIRSLEVIQKVYPSAFVNIWARHLQPPRFDSRYLYDLIRELNVLSLITSSFKSENDHGDVLLCSRIDIACELGCSGVILPGHCPEWVFSYPKRNLYNSCMMWATGIRPAWYTSAVVHAHPVTPSEAIQNGADRIIVGAPIMQPYTLPYRESAMKSLGLILDEVHAVQPD